MTFGVVQCDIDTDSIINIIALSISATKDTIQVCFWWGVGCGELVMLWKGCCNGLPKLWITLLTLPVYIYPK